MANYGQPLTGSPGTRYTMNTEKCPWLHFKCHENDYPNLSLPFPGSKWSGRMTSYTWHESHEWWYLLPWAHKVQAISALKSRALPNKVVGQRFSYYLTWPKHQFQTDHKAGDTAKKCRLSGMNNFTCFPDLSWNVLPNWFVLIASCNPKLVVPGAGSSKSFTTGFCLKTYPL